MVKFEGELILHLSHNTRVSFFNTFIALCIIYIYLIIIAKTKIMHGNYYASNVSLHFLHHFTCTTTTIIYIYMMLVRYIFIFFIRFYLSNHVMIFSVQIIVFKSKHGFFKIKIEKYFILIL